MKKLAFLFVAVAAMSMVSCGGNTANNGECCGDSACCDSTVEVVDSVVADSVVADSVVAE